MPTRPRQPCKTPGCRNLAEPGQAHCATDLQRKEALRGSAARRGYGRPHQNRFRIGVLTRDRICVVCRKRAATVADHYPLSRRQLVQQGKNPDDPKHGRGLCHDCHSIETAQHQPGGWNA